MADKRKKKVVKDVTKTLRINKQWDDYIEQIREIKQKETKMEVTSSWVILSLMEYGMAPFEAAHKIIREKGTKKPA